MCLKDFMLRIWKLEVLSVSTWAIVQITEDPLSGVL